LERNSLKGPFLDYQKERGDPLRTLEGCPLQRKKSPLLGNKYFPIFPWGKLSLLKRNSFGLVLIRGKRKKNSASINGAPVAIKRGNHDS